MGWTGRWAHSHYHVNMDEARGLQVRGRGRLIVVLSLSHPATVQVAVLVSGPECADASLSRHPCLFRWRYWFQGCC